MYLNNFKFFYKKIKPEHIIRYLSVSILIILGYCFFSFSDSVGHIYKEYDYLNTNAFGIKETCDDNGCFWRLEQDKSICIPVILNKGYTTKVDLTYRSITEPMLNFEVGNFKDKRILDPTDNEFKGMTLIEKEVFRKTELTQKMASREVKWFLRPIFGVSLDCVRLRTNAAIDIKKIDVEQFSKNSYFQYFLSGMSFLAFIYAILIFMGIVKTEYY